MSEPKKIKVRVYHAYYGCETGCCGHIVILDENDSQKQFEFDHIMYGGEKLTMKTWATKFAEEVIQKKWPECLNSIDWDSLQWEECSDE